MFPKVIKFTVIKTARGINGKIDSTSINRHDKKGP
jgi:hypothetical protein